MGSVADFIAWLSESPEGPIPAIDVVTLVPPKICYAACRFAIRLAIGKTKRDSTRIANSFWLKELSPSFQLVKWLNATVLSKPASTLIKVRVPKYGYQYFCRAGKGDFTPGRENEMIELFRPAKADVVVDVGAHIGRYTIISSKRVGPKGRVIAVEADRNTYEILDRNIRLNGLTNVLALNRAAYSVHTVLKLYQPNDNFSIYDTVMPSRAGINQSYVEVEAHTLDSILDANGLTAADWIKIDVEGAEYEVLKGATKTLAANHDTTILMEIHDVQDSKHYDKIIKFMEACGFEIEFEKSYSSGREWHVIFSKQARADSAYDSLVISEQKISTGHTEQEQRTLKSAHGVL